MASIWTVAPEEKRENLVYVDPTGTTHPFSITLKRHLTVGEERAVMTAGWAGVRPRTGGEAEIRVDWNIQGFARARAYLIDWSLTDDKGVKLPITAQVIETLHSDVFTIIDNAITAHVEAMAEEKKARSGGSAPSPTSV